MATSPDYLRLASSATRALADTVLDGLRDAVLVCDAHLKQLPIVLANSAACRSLRAEGDTSPLIEVPLLRLLGAESIVAFERALGVLLDGDRVAHGKGPVQPRLPEAKVANETKVSAEAKAALEAQVSSEAKVATAAQVFAEANSVHEVKRAAETSAPKTRAAFDARQILTRNLVWRLPQGDRAILTDLKLLPGSAGHPLVMLSFAPVSSDVAAALHQLPIDMLILDADLRVTYANSGAMRTGASMPGGVLGCSALSLTPTGALPEGVYTQALQGKPFHDDALAYTEPDMPTRWFEVSVQPLNAAAGVTGLLVLYSEVTERRMRNRARGGAERRLLALTEHAQDIITVTDRAGCVQYVSGGVRNSLGYTSEERRSNSLFDHLHPDDLADVRAKFHQLVAGEIAGFSKEMRVRHKDGEYRWLESSFVSALSNPLIGGVVVNSRDITERKQAELKLAQREEVFRLAADAVDGVIFEWDIRRGVVHRSRGVKEVLGMPPEDLEASHDAWVARVHPRDYAAAQRIMTLGLLRGRGWTVTYRIRDARGIYKAILERTLIQRNQAGDPVRAIGCSVDVSEIKRLTDILAESQSTAKIGGWDYSYATRELTWTDQLYRIFEATPTELTPTWEKIFEQCLPESAMRLHAALSRARSATGSLDLEIEINTLKGNRLWVRVIGHVERLDGRLFRAFGSVQDIQAQKMSQSALENSTAWLKLSMNMAHMHAWRWEKDQDTFEFTTLEGNRVRLPSVYPGMAKMLSKVHPKDQLAVRCAIERAFDQHVEVHEEFRLQGADGRYRAYASTARPLFDADNKPRGLVGVVQDITLRRDSERRLRESEELLRTTTSNTEDTLFLLDASLRVRFINRGVNGIPVDAIVGSDVNVLVPEPARARVLKKLRGVLASGETATYEFKSEHDGKTQYFENHAVAVREDGIGAGISISMRDITERKRLVQEILDVSTRERQSIGRDLHDGLGQELTGLALMLRGLATRIQARCPDVVDNVNEVVSLVNQSIETARSLAHGLLPVRTESGGLRFALRALATRGRDLYGLNVNFCDQMTSDFELNEKDASHLYRIAQEALTNAARHGRATRVDIVLEASAQSFCLRISDDGVGFSLPLSSSGMGLKIMRYRAGMIGAKFEVGDNEPHGAVITVTSERPVPVRINSGPQGDVNDNSQQRLGSVSRGSRPPFGAQRR
jgi:PAS domain S-box-containing protein